MAGTNEENMPRAVDHVEDDTDSVDQEGLEIMEKLFGSGSKKRNLLVAKGVTLKNITKMSK